jgi:uncharacterized protein YkwD
MRLRVLTALLFGCGLLAAGACSPLNGGNADDPPPAEKIPDIPKAVAKVIADTNAFRKDEKRAAVTANDELTATAKYFAEFMASTDEYGHQADKKEPADRAKEHGYDYCLIAENIAYVFNTYGFTTDRLAEQFVTGWKESPGHRKNMLDPDVTETGVAVARSAKSGKYYAVQMFGRPKSAAIEFSVANESGEAVKYEIDGQPYDLPPRTTTTHRLCRPEELKPKWDGGEAVRPENGAKFAVVKDAAGLRLKSK